MKVNLFLLLLCGSIAIGWTLYSDRKALPTPPLLQAPNFDYITLNNKTAALKDHQGHITLIHFWATWCAPCVVEFPMLIDMAQKQKDITILAIAVQDKKQNIDRFLKKIDKQPSDNFIIALDPNKQISQTLYGTEKLPETYLLNADHQIIRKMIGAQTNWNSTKWHPPFDTPQKSE